MRIVHAASIFALTTGAAAAQELPADLFGPQAESQQSPAEGEAEEELSELEMLSRGADDPFAHALDTVARKPVSVTLRALDKITARYRDIEISMNEIARFGSLEIQPRYCDKRPPEEFPETTAFLEIFDTEHDARQNDLKVVLEPSPEETPAAEEESDFEVREIGALPIAEAEPETAPVMPDITPGLPTQEVLEGPQAEGENIFRGWMFASSPALNALEHPVYDVWVIDCTTEAADN